MTELNLTIPIKTYQDKYLLVLGGFNAVLLHRLGLRLSLFRYDPILIRLYFSCPECPIDVMETFRSFVSPTKQQAMIERVVELGVPSNLAYKVLECCHRIKVCREKEYRFQLDELGCEEIVYKDEEIYSKA